MSVSVESKNKEFKTFKIDLKELDLDQRRAKAITKLFM